MDKRQRCKLIRFPTRVFTSLKPRSNHTSSTIRLVHNSPSFSSVQVTILSLILQYLSISNYPQLQFLHQNISSQYSFFSVFTYVLSSQCSSINKLQCYSMCSLFLQFPLSYLLNNTSGFSRYSLFSLKSHILFSQ